MELRVEQLHITARMKGGVKSTVVEEVSLSVEQGRRLAIVGRSGCGKTMTAMAILGLLPENCKESGCVRWNGQNMLAMSARQRRNLLGTELVLIPQSGADFLNPSLRVRRQFCEAMQRAGIPKGNQKETMYRLLECVGFEQPDRVLQSYPFQLSGGMAQRVIMAMAAVGNPGLVIADEPTRGIDHENTRNFLENLDALFGQAAVLLITHDISVAIACDDVLVMNAGCVVEYGPAVQVLRHPKNAYTRELIRNLPKADDAGNIIECDAAMRVRKYGNRACDHEPGYLSHTQRGDC